MHRRHFIGSCAMSVLAAACGRGVDVADVSSPAEVSAVPTVASPPIVVELTHDIVCPWCRIGHGRLKRALAAWSGRPVVVRYRPFLLEPGTPPEGQDLRQRLGAKYGADRIDAMFRRVTEIGRADGLVFDFAKIHVTPDSTPAHMMIDAAPDGRAEAVLDALHEAYFVRGDNIGERTVLVAVAQRVGLDAAWIDKILSDTARRARVREEASAASRGGISGVPHFVFAGRVELRGAQPVAAIRAALEQVASG